MSMPGGESWINTWKWEGKAELMCQTGAGGQPWKSWRQEMDGSRAGAQVRVRPKPPALGMVLPQWEQQHLSTSSTLPLIIPAPTEPVPGLLPLLPGMEYAPRQGIFRVQCRASSNNSQTLNYCKVVGEMQPETFPFHVFQFIRLFGLNSIFLPLALEQGKCILKGKFYKESKIKALIMASSMCWGEARKAPGLCQPSKSALQATTF